MRYKFIILFLLIGFVSKAQVYQLMPQYGYDTKRMNFDSTIQIPTFCGVPKLGSNKTNKGALAFDSCNNRFYYFNPKTQVWDTIKSADASLFVKYTDTAQMLSAYLKKQDTVSLSNRIEGRIDSLKLSNDSVYARKNNQFVFQYMNDTATVVKAFVRNSESFTINRGQVVYIFGASGDKASVKLADNSGDVTSARTLGIVRESIAAGQTGWVTTQGQVGKLQLGAYNEGDILWLDSIPGGFTKTKPVAPRHSVFLGVVERANNGNGVMYVKPQNGYELGELHDVKITSPQTNEVLVYTTNIWENKNIYSIVDTTSLSNRINTKLNISDTSAMLSPYARTNSVNASLATKLNISDTANMLNPYLRKIDTTNRFVTSVFRKTASDSVFFVRGGTNNFAFRDSTGAAGWGLLGNSGTSDATNFIGTTDNQDVIFRRNNVISGRIDSTSQSSGNGGITAFGFGANPTAPNATAFGFKALARNTSSSNLTGNVAVGNLAGTNITSGERNTIIGANSLGNATVGSYNSTLGFQTLSATTGDNNTAIGAHALGNNTTGSQNTALGDFSGGNTTGTNNTFLGSRAGRYNNTASNQIFINSIDRSNYTNDQNNSPFYAQQNSTVANQIVTLNGRVGINTISPSASAGLQVESTTQGFLQPRLTTTQMNAISTPATGLSVFNTTDSVPYTYRGSTGGWQKNVIYNRNNDVALFNGANQRIMIDTTTNIVAGRTLTVEAGSTQSGGTTSFQALSQGNRQYTQMSATSGGDIYVTVFNGDIFKRTGGTGNFTALSQTSRQWIGIAAAPNGDVFASVINNSIFKQTGGTGNFVSLGITGRDYRGMCVAPNGDIYVCVNAGDIFKSTDNGVTFTALSQTSRAWYGMAAASNGDIYACVNGGDVYKQTGGTGNFVAMGFTSRNYQFITIAANGDIYATTYPTGNIFRSTGGSDLISLNQTTRDWQGIVAAPNGDIYANVFGGDIYIQTGGTVNLNGGNLVLQSGTGKGTGTSIINFNTATPTVSGTALQNVSTKMTILGNGRVGIGTTSPSSILDVSSTTSAFLPPRMTTAQRDLITPVAGMIIYNSTTNKHQGYNGTTWNDFY